MRTGRIVARTVVCSSALMLGYATAVPVMAADFAYDVNVGLGHSDNIRRTAIDEEDETIAAAGLRFSLDQHTARLRADAVGNLSYAEYLDDTFDSEVLGNFAGNARFGFVPERFEWVMSDNFGQTLSDPFAPATPDNRENINYFSTGPDVTLAFGSRTRLRLGARYSLATYEDSPLDFDTVTGTASLVRMLSAASNVALNVRSSQTEYDEAALNGDYKQSDASVSYDLTGARTRLALEVGYSALDRDAAEDTEDGLLLRFDVTRRLTSSSAATVQVGREFANSGTAFADMQIARGGIGLGATEGRQTAQPFVNDYVRLGWGFRRNRTSLDLSSSWSDQSYEDASELDQKLTVIGAQIGREMSSRITLEVHAYYLQANFQQPDTDYSDLSGGLGFAWRLSRSVSLNVTYDHAKRTSDVLNGDSTENRFWLSIAYGRGTPRTSPLGPQFSVDTGS